MSPKEFEFMFALLEETAKGVYALGYADGKDGKPLKDKGFKPSKAHVLLIKTKLKKHAEKR